MRYAIVLLLAAPALAGGPGYGDIFDPFSPMFPTGQDRTRRKHKAFEQAVARSGPARAVKEFRAFEPAIGKLRKNLDKEWAAYGKIAEKWWGWRRRHERDHQKRYGRPPAEYPVPPGLNTSFLDQEKRFRKSRSLLLRERLFHEWCLARTVALLRDAGDGTQLAKVAAELKRKPPQALRAARILVALDATESIDAALKPTKRPGVLAALLAGASWSAARPFLVHAAWPVRAGAVRAAKRDGRDPIVPLYERLAVETGRLRDDLTDALRVITGNQLGSDAAAWKKWYETLPGGWSAPPRPPAESDRAKAPGVFSDSKVTAFGVPTGSRALVYCVDATDPAKEEVSRSVASLPDGALFGVVVYSRGARRFRKGLVAANAASRAALAGFLEKQKMGNAMDPYAGLVAALELAGGGGSKPPVADTLYFAAFMRPRDGRFEDPRQVMLEIRSLNALRGIRIHTFGRSGGGETYYLQELSRPFGGTFSGSGR